MKSPTYNMYHVFQLRNKFERIHEWTFTPTTRNEHGEQLYTLWSELDKTEPVVENVTFWVLQLEFDLINDDISQEQYDKSVEVVSKYDPVVW